MQRSSEESQRSLEHHHRFAYAVTMFQVSIALAAVAALSRQKIVWLVGLAISIATGVVLFSARATEVAENGTFRLKMLLLVLAVLIHFVFQAPEAKRVDAPRRVRTASAVSLTLWLGLAATACAFILLE